MAVATEIGVLEHRVRDRSVGDAIEISTGTWFGAAVRATFASGGTVAIGGRSGVLHPGDGATLPRNVAELGLDGTYRARAWLDIVGGVRLRSYTTAVARQHWTAPYLGMAARLPFAVRGLRGTFDVAVHPFASVSGLTRPDVAITSGAGVAYARGRIDAQLRYTLERYEFAGGTSSQRLEQLSAVTFVMQVRVLGRTP